MDKKIYTRPSVEVFAVNLKHNLCYEVSGGGGVSGPDSVKW